MEIKRKVVFTAVAALALGGIGAGTAIAQSTGGPSQPVPAQKEQAGPDQDNVDLTPANEQGKPEAPDSGSDAADAQEGPAKAAEAPKADGTNHQDPNGANVDYTPAGEQSAPAGQG